MPQCQFMPVVSPGGTSLNSFVGWPSKIYCSPKWSGSEFAAFFGPINYFWNEFLWTTDEEGCFKADFPSLPLSMLKILTDFLSNFPSKWSVPTIILARLTDASGISNQVGVHESIDWWPELKIWLDGDKKERKIFEKIDFGKSTFQSQPWNRKQMPRPRY